MKIAIQMMDIITKEKSPKQKQAKLVSAGSSENPTNTTIGSLVYFLTNQ